jgi:hypothetical protein
MDLPSNLPNVMPEPDQPEATPAPKPKGPPNEFEKIIGVFFEPAKTFADLGRHPNWWVPWLLLSVVSLGWIYAVQTKIGWDQVAENNVKMSPKQADALDKLPADQRDQRMAFAAKITKGIAWATPIMILVFTAIFAGLYLAIYNFGLGAKVTYGRSLAIAMYASLPSVLKYLLGIVFVFILDPETYNMQQPVASNLGALIDPMQHRFLFGVLSGVDLFIIWGTILTAIGFEQCTKVKRWTGFAALYGVIMFFIIAFAALGAAMS